MRLCPLQLIPWLMVKLIGSLQDNLPPHLWELYDEPS